ncbi:MAG: GspH/FimT family pseudopilin [Gammaproteobacteria bacterium]|nr:GspH/FimT family pseudopilin [Gammaproteobacteria bacterium]
MKRQKGFTLPELLVTIACIAILLAIGVPSFRYVRNNYRITGEINGLLGDLQYARAEAIKEGQWVTACVSNNGTTCAGTTTWAQGWIVYSNPLNNNVPAAGSVLRIQAAFTGAFPDTFNASNGVTAITFNREGFATTAAGFPNTTITLHERTSNPTWTQCLWITPVGLMTTETPANNPSGTCA